MTRNLFDCIIGSMNSDTMLRYLLWYSSEFGDRVFYIQEFIENLGYDVRLFVIHGQVIARMRRMSTSDFRYNLAQGGSSEDFKGTEYDRLALESTEALNAEVAGVDVMPTRDGALVMEINIYPGFQGLVKTTGIPVPRLLVDYFKTLM